MAVSVETMNVMNNLSLKAGSANGDERCCSIARDGFRHVSRFVEHAGQEQPGQKRVPVALSMDRHSDSFLFIFIHMSDKLINR
jgi:hypothetical protein